MRTLFLEDFLVVALSHRPIVKTNSMKKILISALFFVSAQTVFAQTSDVIAIATPTPKPITITETITKNLERIEKKETVSRENRTAAYAFLMEGQRIFWKSVRARSSGGLLQAKESFRKAVELDPHLAEAYTGYADVAWLSFRVLDSASDLEDTIALAGVATKLSPNSFAPRRFLAMAWTEKSRLREGNLDLTFAEKAISEWKEVGRIDPRNAEAFAFLNLFFERTRNKTEQIEALKNWLAASNPTDSRYYQDVNKSRETLSPDNAPLKLGKALLEAGRNAEAVEFLSRAVADNADDERAVGFLREAVESGDFANTETVIQSLQQAVFANPKNPTLRLLLADLQIRSGRLDDALKFLREAMAKIPETEESAIADLQVKLGDIYLEKENYTEAVAAYQTALKLRKLETSIVTEEERLFVMYAYEKIVQSYKNANLLTEAKAAIDKAKILLGKDDTFSDDLLISFYRETGRRDEALKIVREMRLKNAEDYGLLRLEATVLTETGKTDEAVALIKPLLGKTSPQYNDFTNYVFISTLYAESSRTKEAIQTANQAFSAATNEEEKQIAKLVLASAQQMSGDVKSAEETLRTLLKQTPRNPMALNNLGYFLLERNIKFEEALDLIQQAVKIDPTNPSYLDSLGWAYFKLGKFDEAEKYLKNASRLSASATIFEHLGDVYQKQNKPELAKSNWRKALNLASDKEMIERLKLKLK